jgi:hypothetical protein
MYTDEPVGRANPVALAIIGNATSWSLFDKNGR